MCAYTQVIEEIGIERIASVVSDDTNATKKARRDLVTKYPTIINLADPCHKFNLCIQDICSDEMFEEASTTISLNYVLKTLMLCVHRLSTL